MKTSDPWDWTIFDPRAIIRTILVEVHRKKLSLHTKYQRPGPSNFRQEDFLLTGVYVKQVKVNPRSSFFFSDFTEPMSPVLHTKSQGHWPFGSIEEDFNVGIIWAWWPSWSCDKDAANKFSFPRPMEASYEVDV